MGEQNILEGSYGPYQEPGPKLETLDEKFL